MRLSNLVADIIQLSRLDEKNSDLPFEPVDLYELAEDIVLHLDSAASKKNINVSLEGNAVTVQGVRHVIYEMLYNIADNAIRYTDQNGTVNIFTGTVNGHAFYRVEDNGIGMTKERLNQVRGGLTTKIEDSNDFYGLYNVNERIRLKFGEEYGLSIDSVLQEGTCVEVWLPWES